MNADYLFYLRPAKPGPYSLDDLGDVPPPIGSGEAVRESIARALGTLDWRESPDVPGAWFGTGPAAFQFGPPLFQFTVEPDGQVTSFMGSRLERRRMLELIEAMGLIALDLQHDVVYA